MTDKHINGSKSIRINNKLATMDSQLRLNIVALSRRAGDSEHQDEAMKFSQAALNLANTVATLGMLEVNRGGK